MEYIYICPKCGATFGCEETTEKICPDCHVHTYHSGYSNDEWYAIKAPERMRIKKEFMNKEQIEENRGRKEDLTKEFRMRCNVCGKIFCYTLDDLKKNASQAGMAALLSFGAAFSSFAGTRYDAYELNKMADSNSSGIIDYGKCPNCNSRSISPLPEEDSKPKEIEDAKGSTTLSAVDEIKKFKELLDMGIITQDEFDIKKKQLLGL